MQKVCTFLHFSTKKITGAEKCDSSMNSIDNRLKFGEASARNPGKFWAVRQLYEFHRFGIKNAKGLYFLMFFYEQVLPEWKSATVL